MDDGGLNMQNWGYYEPSSLKGYDPPSLKGHLGLQLMSPMAERDTKPFLSGRDHHPALFNSNRAFHPRDCVVSEPPLHMDCMRGSCAEGEEVGRKTRGAARHATPRPSAERVESSASVPSAERVERPSLRFAVSTPGGQSAVVELPDPFAPGEPVPVPATREEMEAHIRREIALERMLREYALGVPIPAATVVPAGAASGSVGLQGSSRAAPGFRSLSQKRKRAARPRPELQKGGARQEAVSRDPRPSAGVDVVFHDDEDDDSDDEDDEMDSNE